MISAISDDEIIYVDEVGFNVSMRTKKGRSLIGTPAVKTVPSIRSRNISVCCAMGKRGIINFKIQVMAFKTTTFGGFIDELLSKRDTLNFKQAIIIMDNVTFHKNINIKQKFNEISRKLMFLPPYSPFLNPIEHLFSKWKLLIRQSNPMNEPELLDLIQSTSKQISKENCEGFFRSIYEFLPKCLNSEPIFDGN